MYIIEETDNGLVTVGLDARLLKDRVLFLHGEINSDNVLEHIQALMYLDSESRDPIQMYINSPGGSVTDGFALIDVMRNIKAPVHTIVTGTAASMGALIAMAGEPGFRAILPNSIVMLHNMSAGIYRDADSFANYADHVARLKAKVANHIVNCTKIKRRQVPKYIAADLWIEPDEAVELGIVDKVI